jgi:hypothetical protein
MRKLVIAEIKPNDLTTVGTEVHRELQCLAYGDNVTFEKGNFYIIGRDNIKRFVANLKTAIAETREVFKDAQSITEFQSDESFLDSLLKLKAR